MDAGQVKRKYRRNAILYDLVERPTRRMRERAIARLAPAPGEIVVDLGCGTGLSFTLLERGIGPRGRLIGVDVSPDMLARARAKVARERWTNVTLIEASAEDAELAPESVDAILSFCTHDIMRSPGALRNAVTALRPGGRFVAAGVKRASGVRGLLLNPVTAAYSRPAVSSLEGMDRPWAELEQLMGPLEVDEHVLGTAYIARGVKR